MAMSIWRAEDNNIAGNRRDREILVCRGSFLLRASYYMKYRESLDEESHQARWETEGGGGKRAGAHSNS